MGILRLERLSDCSLGEPESRLVSAYSLHRSMGSRPRRSILDLCWDKRSHPIHSVCQDRMRLVVRDKSVVNTPRTQRPRRSPGAQASRPCKGTGGEGGSPPQAAVLSPADSEAGAAPFMGVESRFLHKYFPCLSRLLCWQA